MYDKNPYILKEKKGLFRSVKDPTAFCAQGDLVFFCNSPSANPQWSAKGKQFFSSFFFCESGSHFIAQPGLELNM